MSQVWSATDEKIGLPRKESRSVQVHSVHSTGDLEDGLGESLDVAGRDTSDRDTAILGSVDGVFLGQGFHLFRLQTGVGEHADLKKKE